MKTDEWDKMGRNIKTNSIYDEDGFDIFGWNAEEVNKETQTKYDKNGFDMLGFDKDGFDRKGFDREGIHKETKTMFDSEGFNRKGLDIHGFNRDGLNKNKKTRYEIAESKDKQRKNFFGLMNNARKLATGKITLEQYMKCSKVTIDELIRFAKSAKMEGNIIKGLYKYKKQYDIYKRPFNKKEYLDTTIVLVDGKEVKPTSENVDKCIEYMKERGDLICAKTVQNTVSLFLRGKIELTPKIETAKSMLESKEIDSNTKKENNKDINMLSRMTKNLEYSKKLKAQKF